MKRETLVLLKKYLPQSLQRTLTGLFYGWHGDFSSWEKASKGCSGYNDPLILEKVRISALKVRDGRAAYERDSVIYDEVQYSYPLLSVLMWIAVKNNGRLNVLDFGGSLGSSYYQNKRFLDSVGEVEWCVVEQPGFVEEGLKDFTTDRLRFFYYLDECFKTVKIDVVLLSSVLQYLKDPYLVLDQIKGEKVNHIIIDRTPFISGVDRITIQKVHPSIYRAKYPCWFFNKEKFLSYFNQDYDLILEFDALDHANLKSEFKGFLLERKSI
jgi:putative methyltransferase (TIGR04325 family)